jgi:hypothetical protein
VTGTLYVDDLSPSDENVTQNSQPGITPGGSDVSALPYEYTIGS